MGRKKTKRKRQPSLTELRQRRTELLLLRNDANRSGNDGHLQKLRIRLDNLQKKIQQAELAQRRTTKEFIELANRVFDQASLTTSWQEYQLMLKDKCRILPDGRPDWEKDSNRRRPPEGLLETQAVVRRALKGIVEVGKMPALTFQEVCSHAEHVRFHIGPAAEEFRRYTVADEFHDLIYWELLDADPDRIRMCDCGCELYFWDNTRNRSGKHYPGHGTKVRQRRWREKST